MSCYRSPQSAVVTGHRHSRIKYQHKHFYPSSWAVKCLLCRNPELCWTGLWLLCPNPKIIIHHKRSFDIKANERHLMIELTKMVSTSAASLSVSTLKINNPSSGNYSLRLYIKLLTCRLETGWEQQPALPALRVAALITCDAMFVRSLAASDIWRICPHWRTETNSRNSNRCWR